MAIPRVVHRCWFGSKKMPDRYRDYGRQWESFGYEVRDWTEATLPPLVNRRVWDDIGEHGANPGGGIAEVADAVQRADMASYELIWQMGGVYANCDIEPLRPLHDLLEGVSCFAVVEQGEYLSNALMGCEAAHPFMAAVIDLLPGRFDAMRGSPMNETTGPHLLSAARDAHPDLVTVLWDGAPFFPYDYCHMEAEGGDHPDFFVEHHWGHKHPELVEE